MIMNVLHTVLPCMSAFVHLSNTAARPSWECHFVTELPGNGGEAFSQSGECNVEGMRAYCMYCTFMHTAYSYGGQGALGMSSYLVFVCFCVPVCLQVRDIVANTSAAIASAIDSEIGGVLMCAWGGVGWGVGWGLGGCIHICGVCVVKLKHAVLHPVAP